MNRMNKIVWLKKKTGSTDGLCDINDGRVLDDGSAAVAHHQFDSGRGFPATGRDEHQSGVRQLFHGNDHDVHRRTDRRPGRRILKPAQTDSSPCYPLRRLRSQMAIINFISNQHFHLFHLFHHTITWMANKTHLVYIIRYNPGHLEPTNELMN